MPEQGVLVIGHGSNNTEWVVLVDEAVAGMKTPFPVFASFLELVPGRSIADGLRFFVSMGVDEVVAVPLFVSSGSTHIDEIRYMLGVGPRKPFMEGLEPIPHDLRLFCQGPMDDHPLVLDILVQRLRRLTDKPEQSRVLLVAHGTEEEGLRQRGEAVLSRMATTLRDRTGAASVRYATHLPDNIRRRAEEELEMARPAGQRLLVLPIFLSGGYFTQQVLPAELEGLDYIYSGETYLPHGNVSRWLDLQATPLAAALEGARP